MTQPYRFTVTDPSEQTDDDIIANLAFTNVIQRELFPEEPPQTLERAFQGARRLLPPGVALWHIRAFLDEEVVASAALSKQWEDDNNPDLGYLQARVHPAHRQRGLATSLLAYQAAFGVALGRTRYLFSTSDRAPQAQHLAGSLQAEAKSSTHDNLLIVSDVDPQLLRTWLSPSDRYELLVVDGALPDDLVDAYVELYAVMNDAPTDELQRSDGVFTVETQRQREDNLARTQTQVWTALLREVASRRLVGLHTMSWNPSNPVEATVGGTGVGCEQRGEGLAKWLKAALMLRLLEERPEVLQVSTSNGDSNGPMLSVNTAMGYRPVTREVTWEVSLATVLSWLDVRGVALPDVTDAVDAQRH